MIKVKPHIIWDGAFFMTWMLDFKGIESVWCCAKPVPREAWFFHETCYQGVYIELYEKEASCYRLLL
jgi:hypothetical protein